MARAVVIGLGRSGVGAANLLAARGMDVTVTDNRGKEVLAAYAARLAPGVRVALGGHPEGLAAGADLVVVSPGVPLDIPFVAEARAHGARVIGELELGWEGVGGVPVYAVTGTNGKSTTATLLHLMLSEGLGRAVLGGNIGVALTGLMDEVRGAQAVVVEVSSFQLEAVETFRPRGALVLNVTPDHLDRYGGAGGMDAYRAAKARIAENQGAGDFLVLNADDPECMKIGAGLPTNGPEVLLFSRRAAVRGVFARAGDIVVSLDGEARLMGAGEVRIRGAHNLENAMAAAAAALRAGCSPEVVARVLREFPGLEHRLEFVREVDGVEYVNDSKGTNVGAVVKSLEGFDRPVVLIAGGRDKAGEFAALRDAVRGRVRALVLIGEAAGKIEAALGDLAPCHGAGSMEEAVARARRLAAPGDAVLLSPACASFDMFRDFEDRGARFKGAVWAL
jgi:UDP-N-acetylmuramoylalanine--D-glutamate ligase